MAAVAHFFCQPNSHPFQERHVPLGEPTKIGRSVARCRPSPNNAVFDCKVLSRNHALLWFENGKFYLQDTKSSNGTFVNNQRLSKAGEESAAVEVNSYDVVQFGVDVVDSMRKVTHGCIVSQLRLYLPNGEESQQRNCAWNNKLVEKIPNINPSMQSQDLYQLHHFLQEALHREQMLEQKLALLQRLLLSSQDASDKGWQALIDEDKLLSRLEFLENQLQAYNKTQTEDSLKNQLQQVQEEKYNYENTSKETLRQALQEKLDAVQKLSNMERCLSNSEDDCTHLRHVQQQTQDELASLSASHQAKVDEVEEIMEKLQEVERKHTESANEVELQKQEIEKKFETLKEEEEKLRKNVELLEEDNKRLKLISENQQNEATMVNAEVQYENVENSSPVENVPSPTADNTEPFQLTVDEVLGELDDIEDAYDDDEATNVEETRPAAEEQTGSSEQVVQWEEKLKEVERERLQEEERRKNVEATFDQYKQEREEWDSQLAIANKELRSYLNDVELQTLLEIDVDSSQPATENVIPESLNFIKSRILQIKEKLEEVQAENSKLRGEVQQNTEHHAAVDGNMAVGDAFVGEKAGDDVKRRMDEELAETRLLVRNHQNEIKILKDELLTTQEDASVVSNLKSELATSHSLVQSKEAELLKVYNELSESKAMTADLLEKVSTLNDELSREREASSKQLSVCEELRGSCQKQAELIENMRDQERETHKKLEETTQTLLLKEESAAKLKEELDQCILQKQEVKSEFDVLNQSFVELERKKNSLVDELNVLEMKRNENESCLKEQENVNQSLRDSHNEEQKKWENELFQKDEQLADAITRCQQLIQDRDAAAQKEAAINPNHKWILLGLLGVTLALVYYCFFSSPFPSKPI